MPVPPANEYAEALRTLLHQRAWSYRTLSVMTGLSESIVPKICAGFVKSPRGKRRIELALGAPIWASREEFEWLRDVKRITQIDIVLVKGPELINRLRYLGDLKPKPFATREEMISQLLAHFQIQPITTTDQPAHAC